MKSCSTGRTSAFRLATRLFGSNSVFWANVPSLSSYSTAQALPSVLRTSKSSISRDDIISLEEYERLRPAILGFRNELKRRRRIPVGPFATVCFQNYQLVWIQIHEMLRIEKGGEEQMKDEIVRLIYQIYYCSDEV
jgi:hypothetical protein